LLSAICLFRRSTASFSISFDRNDKFDIGLKDCSSKGSKFGFFSSGLTTAYMQLSEKLPSLNEELEKLPSLNEELEKLPSLNEELAMAAMTGANKSLHCFTILVGEGLRLQCLVGTFKMNLCTSSGR